MKDIRAGVYDALGVATPCETFSPLRENPPGPRPVRDLEHPLGLLSHAVKTGFLYIDIFSHITCL